LSNQSSKQNTEQSLDRIIGSIRKLYTRLNRKKLYFSLLIPISFAVLAFALFIYLESVFYFSATTKILTSLLILGWAVSLHIYLNKWLKKDSFADFYRKLTHSTQLPELKYAIDLKEYPRSTDSVFYNQAIAKNLESVSRRDLIREFKQYERNHQAHVYNRYGMFAAVIAIGFFAITGNLHHNGLYRVSRFWHTFQKPNPYSFEIKPGNITLEQGSTFQPEIQFKNGKVPKQISLAVKTQIESEYRLRQMQSHDEGNFSTSPLELTNNATYYIKMDKYKSPLYNVNVQLRPRFEHLSAVVHPPHYTRQDSTEYDYPFSQIEAYQGSQIQIKGKSNKPIEQLTLIRQATGDTLSINPVGDQDQTYQYSLKVDQPDTLSFVMKDASGLTNKNPFEFIIKPQIDERPYVEILQPDSTLQMAEPGSLDVVYKAGDDFGLTRSSLHYEINRAFVDQPEKHATKLKVPAIDANEQVSWNLQKMDLKPRDVVTYWIEVQDNDVVNGYKASRSQKMVINIPSMTEYFDQVDEKENDVKQTLDEVSDSYESMQKEYDRFKEQLRENPQTNWEQKQTLDKMDEKRKKLQDNIKDLNDKFKKVKDELEKNNALSDETLKSYKELQELMDQINDPDLKKALEDLQKALNNMDQQQIKQAMNNMEFNEDVYKERLKRTIELFKQLKMNSDLEKTARSLESLSKQEEKLANDQSPADNQLEKQNAIQQESKKVSDKIDSLSENAPDKWKQKIKDLQQQSKQQMDSIQKNIQQNKDELNKNGNSQQSRQQQQNIQKQFQQMASQMRDAKSKMNQQQTQINLAALQQILYSLINLSETQEDLTKKTTQLDNESQAFVEKAREQKNIANQFEQISDSLFKVSADLPRFSNVINVKKKSVEQDLQHAIDQLAERNKGNSTTAERQSLGGINELTSMIASLIDQVKNAQQKGQGGGAGMSAQQMMEKLKKMSGQQQQMNQQLQKMINDMQGDRLSQDQIGRLNQMAKQQNRIRKQLKDLQRNGGFEPGDKLLSELERMNEQMENSIRDLRGGNTDRELVKRQRNILSKMLSAERAINERGKEKKRRATTAEKQYEQTPPEITLEELRKRIRSRLQDPNQTKFSEDYQKLIEKYFELLQKEQSGNQGTPVPNGD